MTHCSECGGPAHDPEFCPKAETYSGGTIGACEAWCLRTAEGSTLAARFGAGTVEYYEELAAEVDLLHNTGMCGS